MALVVTMSRGPGMTPFSMASFRPTSAYPAPSVPRSLRVVIPAMRLLSAWTTPRAVRSASDSSRTWSVQGVSS